MSRRRQPSLRFSSGANPRATSVTGAERLLSSDAPIQKMPKRSRPAEYSKSESTEEEGQDEEEEEEEKE